MDIDWIRAICIVECIVVAALYLRTTAHGLRFYYQYKQNRPFNLGRALASAGVVVTMGTFIFLLINRWNTDAEPPYFLMVFVADIFYLFGWIYSVRITLKEGRPDA